MIARLQGGKHDGRELPISFLGTHLRFPDDDEFGGRYVLPRRDWHDGAAYVYVWQPNEDAE